MWRIIVDRNELEWHSVMYLYVNLDDYKTYSHIMALSHQWSNKKIKRKNMRNNEKKTQKHMTDGGKYGKHGDF